MSSRLLPICFLFVFAAMLLAAAAPSFYSAACECRLQCRLTDPANPASLICECASFGCSTPAAECSEVEASGSIYGPHYNCKCVETNPPAPPAVPLAPWWDPACKCKSAMEIGFETGNYYIFCSNNTCAGTCQEEVAWTVNRKDACLCP